jgi:glutathione S-transferase
MVRPADKQWPDWREGQMDKIRSALDRMEEWAPGLGQRVDIGTITLGCALGYLDFRFPDLGWRDGRGALADWFERFGARPSMAESRPRA